MNTISERPLVQMCDVGETSATLVFTPAEVDIDKVFDRFYRVDKARSRAAGGTGLGLSIVRDTARRHGGDVSVQRRSGEGTRFVVTFPLCKEEGKA